MGMAKNSEVKIITSSEKTRRFSSGQHTQRAISESPVPSTPTPTTRLASGLIGSAVLTILHEGARRILPSAPRLDILGMRGVAKLFQIFRSSPPTGQRLRFLALVGDIITNTLYYSRVPGIRSTGWLRGLVLGSGAGIATQLLSPLLGLGKKPIARKNVTRVMTVAWYLVGGLAAAWVARRSQPHNSQTSQRHLGRGERIQPHHR
jgi:hypothetical protein